MTTYTQKIYFIASGTSCADILSSIGVSSCEGGECNLTEIGVKQIFMAQSNEKIRGIINPENCAYYLTASNRASIQSGLVFLNSFASRNISILPVPHISKDKDKNKYIDLKRSFNPEFQNKKYWDALGLRKNAVFSNVIANIPKIDWTLMENKNNNTNFVKFLLKLISNNIKANPGMYQLKNIIIICDAKTINEMLKKMTKESKFKIDTKSTYEYSSIWNINISISDKYKVMESPQKVYPTPYLSNPLKYNISTDLYTFPYNGFEFILFNALKKIPLKYLKYITYVLCGKKKDKIVNKIKTSISNTNILSESKNGNNLPIIKNQGKSLTYSNIIQRYG